jgi:hypothetical protein
MFANEGYLNTAQYIYHIQLGLEITDGFGAVRFNKSDIYKDVPLADDNCSFSAKLKVYPNPFVDKVVLDGFKGTLNEISVYNNMGLKLNVECKVIGNDKFELDLTNVTSGIYFIKSGNVATKVEKN